VHRKHVSIIEETHFGVLFLLFEFVWLVRSVLRFKDAGIEDAVDDDEGLSI
jgi:hypothetical protein